MNLFPKRSKNKPQFHAGISRWCEWKQCLEGISESHFSSWCFLFLTCQMEIKITSLPCSQGHYGYQMRQWIGKCCEQQKVWMGGTLPNSPVQPLTCHDSLSSFSFLVLKKIKMKKKVTLFFPSAEKMSKRVFTWLPVAGIVGHVPNIQPT